MLCHLAAITGYLFPFGWVLGPFFVWQIKKQDFPEISVHAKEILNFEISMMIYSAVSAILMFALIGIPLLMFFGTFNLVCILIGAIKANEGKPWRYPLTLRLIK